MGTGPLKHCRVIELAGIGPGPFAAMMLADLGAQVIRVERPSAASTTTDAPRDPLLRNRRSAAVDLKSARGRELVLRLVERSDVLLEGFRPGVTERLGVGPDTCRERNPRLIYGRITGWGQQGPLAPRAGHDIDYIALAGALHPIGAADRPPPPPVNYVGDFGGGGMLLVVGVLAALIERATSGIGQVVDAAMVDGAAAQTAMLHGLLAGGLWRDTRSGNLLDGAAPFYRCYATSDGGYMAVGALESQFYAELLDVLELEPADWPQHDRERWTQQSDALAHIFATRTRDEWTRLFADRDACVTPVLSLADAPTHPHAAAREAFVDVDGVIQPAPAPRFSRTGNAPPSPPRSTGADTAEVLAELGLTGEEITALERNGVIAVANPNHRGAT